MKCPIVFAVSLLLASLKLTPGFAASQFLSLHPENPHYFLYKGKPAILITSGEHYGAVINLDFDYIPYLDELKSKDLNLTRTFSGSYVEPQGAFQIADNTLAPAPNRYIAPWARSSTPGYANGGNKFDLKHWDAAYFKRLKDFVKQAEKRGIIVEMNLFCPFYEEAQWGLSPQNATNNINDVGNVSRMDVYTMDKNGGLLEVHEALVRKIVSELKDAENVYYEVCNEPYFGGVTLDWQNHIVEVIVEAEKKFHNKHLISMNIANNSAKVQKPNENVSIFNFHYASPPITVWLNHGLNKVIGDNETGFRGTNNFPYRIEGWDFIMAGGGLYNNLDYSFTAEHENGTYVYPASQPGGGNPTFRSEMKVLKEFITSFDFVKMKMDNAVIKRGVPYGSTARALAEVGKAYAIYISPTIQTAKDQFSVRWSGKVEPEFSESYTFHTISNDGVKLWVNNQLIITNWTEHAEKEDTGAIALKAGQRYDIRLEYFQNGGGATAKLFWSSPSQPKEIIPTKHLYLPDGRDRGLAGTYYTGKNFERIFTNRVDEVVNFEWNDNSPLGNSSSGKGTNQVAKLSIDLPAGPYNAEWVNTKTGKVDKKEEFDHLGGSKILESPAYAEDIALRIKKGKK